jgi:hypothetical protein
VFHRHSHIIGLTTARHGYVLHVHLLNLAGFTKRNYS